MAKSNKNKEVEAVSDLVESSPEVEAVVKTEKMPTPEEWALLFRDNKERSFSEWYEYRDAYNIQNELSDHVTFKQWYTFKRQYIDQGKSFHPSWSILSSKKCKSLLHDLNMESPEDEFARLLVDHLKKEDK